ncbi:MAG: hypothetical protein EAZ55_01955 [Cytophagales bacterium]|nr:MAG: hypothetical protein EAZ55_01955 [Cytophagales bacterium]
MYSAPLLALFLGGLWGVFKKAGRKGWEAIIPLYNFFVWAHIIKKPWWWVVALFIPILDFAIFALFMVGTARIFGQKSLLHAILSILLFPFYTVYLSRTKTITYQPNETTKA